ncbi:MAG: hypothetical protein H7230_02335 [Candidatus Parcubacteria bacterium]|nr:hypothetical protein [Candidatus Paceibacterota bacterium]
MSIKITKKQLSISGIILAIIAILLLFYPFINPFIFITGTMNYKATDYYKFLNYNPLKPVFVTRPIPSVLIYKTYERVGLFEFKEVANEKVNVLNYNITDNEISDTIAKTDLRNENPDEQKYISTYKENYLVKIESQKEQERMGGIMNEFKKPAECRLIYSDITRNKTGSILLEDLKFLTKNIGGSDFQKNIKKETLESLATASNELAGKSVMDVKLSNPKIYKIIIYFDDNYNTNTQAKITKLVLVDRDCNQTEIPTKPDGTFDFEAVRSKWE